MSASMQLHVYAMSWNEERFLPYFLRHYAFAERITIFDNMSDDRSLEIIGGFANAVVEPVDTGGELRDTVLRDIKNHAWKKSRGQADWVICVDVDELLWHPRLRESLAAFQARGITVPLPIGYEMLSQSFPTTSGQVYDEVKEGVLHPGYSKPCVFNPSAIEEMNYVPGAHLALPSGAVIPEERTELKLLHYRYLGIDYTLERFAAKRARLSEENKRWGWGDHYQFSKERITEIVNELWTARTRVVP